MINISTDAGFYCHPDAGGICQMFCTAAQQIPRASG